MKPSYKKTDTIHFVKEAPTRFYDGSAAIPLVEMTSFQKMQIVRGGINKSYLIELKEETSLDYDALAQALSVTRSTLINKKGDEKFSDHISERIIAVAEIYSFGYVVFEDKKTSINGCLPPTKHSQVPHPLISWIINSAGRK